MRQLRYQKVFLKNIIRFGTQQTNNNTILKDNINDDWFYERMLFFF